MMYQIYIYHRNADFRDRYSSRLISFRLIYRSEALRDGHHKMKKKEIDQYILKRQRKVWPNF